MPVTKVTKKYISVDISTIVEYEKNNKIHSENVDRIVDSIKRNEYISPIIVNQDMVILAWHGRKRALEKMWEKEADVLVVSGLTKKQEADFRIADNRTTELSEWDFDAVLSEIEEFWLEELKIDFQDMDFDDLSDEFSLPSWDKPEIETVTFTLHRDQNEKVKEAIELSKSMGDFGETGNDNSNGNAIARICEMFIWQNE